MRVIGPGGEQLGILPVDQAILKAREADLDLVEVAPNERPSVCRIMDFGKYKYEKKKKAHQPTHQTKTKEIRLRPKTGEHDIEFKVKQARGFLTDRDKVKVNVMFKGREMAHVDRGRQIILDIIAVLEDIAKVEKMPSMEGRSMTAVLTPK